MDEGTAEGFLVGIGGGEKGCRMGDVVGLGGEDGRLIRSLAFGLEL